MNSRRAALLAMLLSTGCLDAMTSDTPGYSTKVLKAESRVPRATSDSSIARRIDANDGVSSKAATTKSGFAGGASVSYWDLGVAKTAGVPAYELTFCDDAGNPTEGGQLAHPWIIDSAPGDTDYTQMFAITPVCITRFYNGEILSSVSALNDAIELELVRDPGEAREVRYMPVLPDDVSITDFPGDRVDAYYRGFAVGMFDFGDAGTLTLVDGRVSMPNVYELMLPGAKTPARIVFAVGPDSEKYAPCWAQYTVVVSETADLTTFMSEADIVTIGEDRSMKPASSSVLAVFASGTRAARPMPLRGEAP